MRESKTHLGWSNSVPSPCWFSFAKPNMTWLTVVLFVIQPHVRSFRHLPVASVATSTAKRSTISRSSPAVSCLLRLFLPTQQGWSPGHQLTVTVRHSGCATRDHQGCLCHHRPGDWPKTRGRSLPDSQRICRWTTMCTHYGFRQT